MKIKVNFVSGKEREYFCDSIKQDETYYHLVHNDDSVTTVTKSLIASITSD
jgi:hypothetical protein